MGYRHHVSAIEHTDEVLFRLALSHLPVDDVDAWWDYSHDLDEVLTLDRGTVGVIEAHHYRESGLDAAEMVACVKAGLSSHHVARFRAAGVDTATDMIALWRSHADADVFAAFTANGFSVADTCALWGAGINVIEALDYRTTGFSVEDSLELWASWIKPSLAAAYHQESRRSVSADEIIVRAQHATAEFRRRNGW